MREPRLTRRSLLASGAGLAAGALARPLPAGAAAPPARLGAVELGDVPVAGRTVELAGPADLVGLSWSRPARAAVRLRLRGPGGRWSPWAAAGATTHGPEAPPPSGRAVGEPVWAGGADAVQLMPSSELAGAVLHTVDVGAAPGRAPAREASLALAAPVLQAGAGQPPIIARSAWALGSSSPRVAPEYGAVKLAFVHHTENPNGYSAAEVPAMLRAIYYFHRYINGWDDIGYNFVVDLYGRAFEARAGGIDESVVGAHAGGYNLVSTGIAVLGSFSAAPISSAARRTLERLIAWKLSLHGVPSSGRVTVRVNPAGAVWSKYPGGSHVSLPRIAGHRDGDSTECPGDVLYGELPAVRAALARLAPAPAAITCLLAAAPPADTAPAPGTAPAPTTTEAPQATPQTTLEGVVGVLAGAPIAGAPVLLQARTVSRRGETVAETQIAETVAGPEGRWSSPVPPPAAGVRGQWVRALFAGSAAAGASVSPAVWVPAPAAVS